MKQKLHLIIISSILMVGCTGGADKRSGHMQPHSDSLYTEELALEGYGENPERALLMIDSAEAVGNISAGRASLLRAKVYGLAYRGERLDTARQICETLLASDFAKHDADKREDVLSLLVAINRRSHDDEQYLHWATLLADHCRQQGEQAETAEQRQTYITETLRTEAEIGLVLTHLGKQQEGEQKLKAVIRQLDDEGSVDRLDACIVSIRRLITVYREQEAPADIIPLAERILEKLDHFEQHPHDYAEDSYRLLADSSHHAGFIDFYRTQAWGYLANAYSTIGETMKAREYLSLFEQSGYGKSYDGRLMIAPTWCLLGDYQKMNAIYDEAAARMGADTVCADYAEILRGRAMAADAQGRHSDYWHRYADLRQVLNDSLQASKAHEYAARYHHQEQQFQIERERAASGRKNIVIGFCAFLVLLAAGFAVYALRKERIVSRMNRSLAQQIDEAVKYKAMYWEEHETLRKKDEASDAVVRQDMNTLTDEQLFQFLNEVIVSEQLFLDPKFSRQTLIDRFQLSKERIGAAFAHGSSHTKLSAYILQLRMEHAARLLIEQPDLSIVQIARDCGFSTHKYFTDRFRQCYEMTPTDFRRSRLRTYQSCLKTIPMLSVLLPTLTFCCTFARYYA